MTDSNHGMSSGSVPVMVKCGRCGVVSVLHDYPKLEHYNIYRVTCPHCGWPGRYLPSELRPAPRSIGGREKPKP